jgi:hypothetical protein
MQNVNLHNLAQLPIQQLIARLVAEHVVIFGEYHDADYQTLVAAFARLNQDVNQFNDERLEELREFIDYGILTIARRYNDGYEIHPGTMNILIMAIQVFNRADGHHPYQFGVEFIEDISPETEEFMEEIVQPITRNLRLFALHRAPWALGREAPEEDPGAETRIARTPAEFGAMAAEFRAMNGLEMDTECPVCMEEFVERSAKGRTPVFMPVVVHKDVKGKWFHPMHTVCINDMKKKECPMCRAKVIWPKMKATRKTRRPNSSPTRRRSSAKRSSAKRSSAKRSSAKRSSPGRSLKRRSADF